MNHPSPDLDARDAHTYRGTPWTLPLVTPTRLDERFTLAARRHLDLRSIIEIGSGGIEIKSVTFRELASLVQQRATRLRRDGLLPHLLVGIQMANTIDDVVDLLAILLVRASAVIVDRGESTARREEQFAAVCDGVITDDGFTLSGRVPQDGPDPVAEVHPTAFVLYTTGSTAASKAVAQSHYAVAVNVEATIRHHAMRAGEVMACALPLSHVNGLHFGLLATLFSGGTCLLFQSFEPFSYLSTLARYKADRATTVPSLLTAISESRRWPALPKLRYFVSAAAPLGPATAAAILDRAGHRIVQGYGLSECMNFATTMPTNLTADQYGRLVLGSDPSPVGHPLFGCEVSVRDKAGLELGTGAVGEVWIRGHSIMTGYLHNEADTADSLGAGWLRTGDLGRRDEFSVDNEVLTITGRLKHIAKCGGLSISLEEVERWIARLPDIRDVGCVARPDPLRGEAICAFYTRTPDSPSGRTVDDHVAQLYDINTLGLRTMEVQVLPRLRSGKIDRRELRRRAHQS